MRNEITDQDYRKLKAKLAALGDLPAKGSPVRASVDQAAVKAAAVQDAVEIGRRALGKPESAPKTEAQPSAFRDKVAEVKAQNELIAIQLKNSPVAQRLAGQTKRPSDPAKRVNVPASSTNDPAKKRPPTSPAQRAAPAGIKPI